MRAAHSVRPPPRRAAKHDGPVHGRAAFLLRHRSRRSMRVPRRLVHSGDAGHHGHADEGAAGYVLAGRMQLLGVFCLGVLGFGCQSQWAA